MYLLSAGNHKLPRQTGIFNLPRKVTCPGSTAYCAEVCYARKAEIQYSNVVPQARRRNWKLSQDPMFVDLMLGELKRRRFKVIRIHESGDFYTQNYLNKWIEIARARPDITFYAYTKSTHLDFTQRPKNFIVRGSVDPTTPAVQAAQAAGLDGIAYTIPRGETKLPAEDIQECPGSCKSCDYCLKPGSVYFHEH